MSGKFAKKSVLFIPVNFKEGDIDILSAVTLHSLFDQETGLTAQW